MRLQMGGFEPTEQEFRQMFTLRKQFEDEFGVPGMQSSAKEEAARRAAAQKELDGQLKSTLGDDRYRLYRYRQDWSSSSLKEVAQTYNIPKETAFKVFDIRNVSQEQAGKVRADASLTPEQRQAALDALRTETEKEVGKVLGPAALQAYIKQGQWIKKLNR